MKILVSGFQRSGTTMTRRLLHYHPNVSRILHEQKILYKRKTKKELLKFVKNFGIEDPLNSNWGDKVPFYSDTPKPQIKYIRKWHDVWKEEARTIYLVRHPVDVAISTIKVKMGPNLKVVISRQNGSIPGTVEGLGSMKGVLIVSFESLVTDPKVVLKKIFEFCSLDSSDNIVGMVSSAKRKQLRYFDSINPDRAFAYKKQTDLKLNIKHYDYEKLRSLDYVI